jgi:hypothetical protein
MLPSLARRDDVAEHHRRVRACRRRRVPPSSRQPRTTIRSSGSQHSSGSDSPPHRPADGLGELVTWQLDPSGTPSLRTCPTTISPLLTPATRRRDRGACSTSTRHVRVPREEGDPSVPSAIAAAHHASPSDEARNYPTRRRIDRRPERGRNCLVLTRRVAHIEHLDSDLAAAGHHALVMQGGMPAATATRHREPPRRRESRRRRTRHRNNAVHRRGLRRTRPRHAVPRRADLLRRLLVHAPDELSAQHPARTSPRSTTTTTGPPRSSPPPCKDACPATGTRLHQGVERPVQNVDASKCRPIHTQD